MIYGVAPDPLAHPGAEPDLRVDPRACPRCLGPKRRVAFLSSTWFSPPFGSVPRAKRPSGRKPAWVRSPGTSQRRRGLLHGRQSRGDVRPGYIRGIPPRGVPAVQRYEALDGESQHAAAGVSATVRGGARAVDSRTPTKFLFRNVRLVSCAQSAVPVSSRVVTVPKQSELEA